MATYKVRMNEDKEIKCTQTKPKCDSKKAVHVQIHQCIE
jgi:metal-sulfur cluster biosynthetic enzyme